MLMLLAVFLFGSLLLPALVRWLGAQAFVIGALVPAAAFVHALTLTPEVLDPKTVPFQDYEWIPQLGLHLSMRMDVLGWVMTLIVTGVGALVLLYCRWYFDGKKDGLGLFNAVLLAFAGAMIMEVTLVDMDSKTDVTIAFHNLPAGVRPEDNDAGTRSSLDKLARYLG